MTSCNVLVSFYNLVNLIFKFTFIYTIANIPLFCRVQYSTFAISAVSVSVISTVSAVSTAAPAV